MARYGSDHKLETRRRIIEQAGRRLKRDGIDRSGIASLMADAGLTNGAFYAHFSSKDELVATVVTDQLQRQRERNAGSERDRATFESFVRDYLSLAHRDHPEEGCPSAALLDEIGRSSNAVRDAYSEGILAMIDDVAGLLDVRIRVAAGPLRCRCSRRWSEPSRSREPSRTTSSRLTCSTRASPTCYSSSAGPLLIGDEGPRAMRHRRAVGAVARGVGHPRRRVRRRDHRPSVGCQGSAWLLCWAMARRNSTFSMSRLVDSSVEVPYIRLDRKSVV